MIAKCEGIQIGKFRIPPFELHEGEFISICLFGGAHFYDLEMEFVQFLTNKKSNPNLTMYQEMYFVKRFQESALKGFFSPITVEKYIKKYGNLGSEELKKIYEIDDYIKPNTKVNTLAINPFKWLSLFTTLSKSKNIVFDLAGQDPLGAERTIDIINEHISKGGAAILLDNFDDSEIKCTKFIKVEVDENHGL